VSHDDSKLEVNFAHRLCAQVVPIGAAVYHVWIFQLRPTAEERLRDLLAHGADRSPRGTLHLVCSRRRRDVAVAVAVKLAAAERVLMPHLEVDFRPACVRTAHKCSTPKIYNRIIFSYGPSILDPAVL